MEKQKGFQIFQQNIWKQLFGKCKLVESTGFLRKGYILSSSIYKKKKKPNKKEKKMEMSERKK